MSKTIKKYTDIEGWFFTEDQLLFDAILRSQTEPGDLVEVGAYLGRSAVVIGDHWRDGESFVVVDLFGAEVDSAGNQAENAKSYPTLTKTAFEANYLALHDTLPIVVQGLSTEVVDHVDPGSARFIHVDASHLYQQVAADIDAVRTLLQPDGVVVFDDVRAEHTPGVTAAVWEAASRGMVPFALSPYKLYATWGDPSQHLATVRGVLDAHRELSRSEQQIMGHTVLRLKAQSAPGRQKPSLNAADIDRISQSLAQELAQHLDMDALAMGVASRLLPPVSRSDLVPPVVSRAVWRRRAARRAR